MIAGWLRQYNPLQHYTTPWALMRRGIMGMNQRNIRYIGRYNPRRLYPLVDDKLKTKLLATEFGITTPKLIGVIDSQHDVATLAKRVEGHSGFVIKPAKGSGGKGILVITEQRGELYFKSSGHELHREDLERHASNILSGLYSLGGKPDVAILETLIEFDHTFADYSYEGVPDIRVIVFLGFPVMAMMRLSTHASDGKANLHQGAVGVGVDIASGYALRAVQFDQPLSHHPDTRADLFQLRVPHWQRLLELACSCYEMTGLGYLGTDMVLDRSRGPMLLELNARPGLAIQIANNQGLLPRLRTIERLKGHQQMPLAERIAFAQEQFGVG